MSRVLVGMSGGADSSLAAALLVEAGFSVCGAYMVNWTMDVGHRVVGQRHGLGVGGSAPRYVVDKDMERNVVYVGANPASKRLACKGVIAEDAAWISDHVPAEGDYSVRMRHLGTLVQARLSKRDVPGEFALDFAEPQPAIAPGQSVVIYQDDVCLGGGIVCSER